MSNPVERTLLKNIGRDASRYLPGRLVTGLAAIIAVPAFTALFNPSDYGDFILIYSTTMFLCIFSMRWLEKVAVRFFPKYEIEQGGSLFYTNIFATMLLHLGLLVILFTAFNFFISPYFLSSRMNKLMFLGIAFFFFFSLSEFFILIFRASRRSALFTKYKILYNLLRIVLSVLIALFYREIASILIGHIIIIAFLIPLMYRELASDKVFRKNQFSLPIVKEFSFYGYPLMLSTASLWFLNVSNRFIIKFFRSSAEVSFYSIPHALSEQSLTLFFSVLMFAAAPIITAVWEKEGDEATRSLIRTVSGYYVKICLPIVVGIGVLSKNIIILLTPEDYLNGHRVIPVVLLAVFFFGFTQYLQFGYLLKHRTREMGLMVALISIFNIILSIFLIKYWGFMGAGFAYLLSNIVMFLCFYWRVKGILKWSFPWEEILKACMASVLMGIGIFLLNKFLDNNLLSIVLGTGAGILVYGSTLIAVKGVSKSEIRIIVSLIKSFFRFWEWKS
ncbi:polysaccharide biosynthesis C-terminal domain-containing protein [bacterium]|nr:polysaccharide biosynthesis C-terminal domain-containing protein [bacterium]